MLASHYLSPFQDRKIIIKSFKSLVCKICKEENGHIVLMAIFDSVDDTVLVRKAILSVSFFLIHSYYFFLVCLGNKGAFGGVV